MLDTRGGILVFNVNADSFGELQEVDVIPKLEEGRMGGEETPENGSSSLCGYFT
jgi:hypothetical protein